MTETTSERDLHIIKVLQEVKRLYHHALEISYEEQQRHILRFFQKLSSHQEELGPLGDACQTFLERYPTGMPHDSTLIQEAKDLLGNPYRRLFPDNCFEEDMLLYKLFNTRIQSLFDTIPKEELPRVEQVIVERLWSSVHNTLVNNPNFKGVHPYYQQNYHEMGRAKKLWLELLDEDYNSYIVYFQES